MTAAQGCGRDAFEGAASGGFRAGLARLFGDGAYRDYLRHWQQMHAGDGAPLGRAEFFRAEQDRRWNGIRRCC